MKVRGIDFTSAPSARKPITIAECNFSNATIELRDIRNASSLEEFSTALREGGPWIAGIDFPFGQSRRFLANTGHDTSWEAYVSKFGLLSRDEWRNLLDNYKGSRSKGDREHQRLVDSKSGGASPQKQYGVPVGLMFHVGAPMLLSSKVTIPGLSKGDPSRIVVEAYPGVRARAMVGKKSYKSDQRKKQTEQRAEARTEIVRLIKDDALFEEFGFRATLNGFEDSLIEDASGDTLDAVLCSLQAAWSWQMRDAAFGYPPDFDKLEGWIPDPVLYSPSHPQGRSLAN